VAVWKRLFCCFRGVFLQGDWLSWVTATTTIGWVRLECDGDVDDDGDEYALEDGVSKGVGEGELEHLGRVVKRQNTRQTGSQRERCGHVPGRQEKQP
jgi:hypothetical protein